MIVVEMSDGLGNQMFQYAFKKEIERIYGKVYTDIHSYIERSGPEHAKFILPEVFPQTVFTFTDSIENSKIADMKRWQENRSLTQKAINFCFPKTRKIIYELHPGTYEEKNLNVGKDAVLIGFWQTEKYFADVKKEILSDFTFRNISEINVREFIQFLEKNNTVSLHVRRGDYLNHPDMFGNICTKKYYENAIKQIKDQVETPVFIIFSDDVEWAKQEYKKESNFLFVEDWLPGKHPDWYEMFLMSKCKYNIIANSTFSWWGAYLNQNEEKMVICPSKWLNGLATPDICPKEWRQIEP